MNERRKALLPYDGIERRRTLAAEREGETLVLVFMRPACDRRAYPSWQTLAVAQARRAAHLALEVLDGQ